MFLLYYGGSRAFRELPASFNCDPLGVIGNPYGMPINRGGVEGVRVSIGETFVLFGMFFERLGGHVDGFKAGDAVVLKCEGGGELVELGNAVGECGGHVFELCFTFF